jgi:hypothetical protein
VNQTLKPAPPVRAIFSHPFTFGAALGLIIAAATFVVVTRFPGTDRALREHWSLLEGIFFTACFFTAFPYFFWRFHRRRGFWTPLCIVFVIHVTGVVLYSQYIHPLYLLQWSLLGFIESIVCAGFMGWWIERVAR